MNLTARQLNRATLARQLLLRREPLDVVDAVHRIVAVQAQEPASMYVALWNRVADFDPADLDRALFDRTIVKATVVRITIHAVDARDYPAFHEAMQPSLRASRLYDTRFTVAGVSIGETDALLPDLLAFADRPRTGAELEAWLDDRLLPRPGKPGGVGDQTQTAIRAGCAFSSPTSRVHAYRARLRRSHPLDALLHGDADTAN